MKRSFDDPQKVNQMGKRWICIWFFLSLPITYAINYLALRPSQARVEAAEAVLEQAGYLNAKVNRSQSPKNMYRCDVGQIKNKGYAYAWETATQSGVFCYPMDGRPKRILLNK